jgi:hypothetical protein
MQTQLVRQRVASHRSRLRDAGLKPVQIWIPDTKRAGFKVECRRQSLLIAADSSHQDDLDFLFDLVDWDEDI